MVGAAGGRAPRQQWDKSMRHTQARQTCVARARGVCEHGPDISMARQKVFGRSRMARKKGWARPPTTSQVLEGRGSVISGENPESKLLRMA